MRLERLTHEIIPNNMTITREHLVDLLAIVHAHYPRLVNYLLAVVYPLHRRRMRDVPGFCYMLLRHCLIPTQGNQEFPPIEESLGRPDGLLAIGGSLSTRRLISAYRNGIYPCCHVPPMKWWAPSERMVLFLKDFHLERRFRRTVRQRSYRVTLDTAFDDVIRACGRPRPGRLPLTWISPEIIEAYNHLHREGHAHSVEVWDRDNRLVGGVYGVAIGRIFFSESQFTLQPDAGKVAAATLNCHLYEWGFSLKDHKAYSDHHAREGARLIKRSEFMRHLAELRDQPGPAPPWLVNPSLDIASWNPIATSI